MQDIIGRILQTMYVHTVQAAALLHSSHETRSGIHCQSPVRHHDVVTGTKCRGALAASRAPKLTRLLAIAGSIPSRTAHAKLCQNKKLSQLRRQRQHAGVVLGQRVVRTHHVVIVGRGSGGGAAAACAAAVFAVAAVFAAAAAAGVTAAVVFIAAAAAVPPLACKRPRQGNARQTARQDQLSRANAKQAIQQNQIGKGQESQGPGT